MRILVNDSPAPPREIERVLKILPEGIAAAVNGGKLLRHYTIDYVQQVQDNRDRVRARDRGKEESHENHNGMAPDSE